MIQAPVIANFNFNFDFDSDVDVEVEVEVESLDCSPYGRLL